MFIVGLTGGIATGKSTVSNIFKDHDIPVIDSDIIARKGKYFVHSLESTRLLRILMWFECSHSRGAWEKSLVCFKT